MFIRDEFSRIGKLFVDQDDITPAQAAARLAGHRIALAWGTDVAASPTLQAAVLTAAAVAARCFPGAVSLHTLFGSTIPMLLPWSAVGSLEEAASEAAPRLLITDRSVAKDTSTTLVFGKRSDVAA